MDLTDELRTARGVLSSGALVLGIVLFVLLLAGPLGGIDFTGEPPEEFRDGNATVTVEEPTTDRLEVTDGRFGTPVVYLRIPDLVANVEHVEQRPRLVYEVSVPAFAFEHRETRTLTSTGQVTVPMRDRGFEQVPEGTHEGRIVVRVQSTDGDWTIVDRPVEVVVR